MLTRRSSVYATEPDESPNPVEIIISTAEDVYFGTSGG